MVQVPGGHLRNRGTNPVSQLFFRRLLYPLPLWLFALSAFADKPEFGTP